MDLPSAEDLKALEATLAPGAIILGIRQLVLSAEAVDLSERLLRYAMVSAAYYALARPLLELAPHRFGWAEWKFELLEYVAAPALIGVAAAAEARAGVFGRMRRRLGARPPAG